MDRPVVADVIVVAAGASQRMGGVDKMLAPIRGRPLLAWTLDALAGAPAVDRIVVVASAGKLDRIAAAPWLPPAVVAVVPGGDRRQVSVARGFDALARLRPDDPDRVILVHDGARPLVAPDLVVAVARAVAEHGAAIPGLAVAETIKRVHGSAVRATVDRADLVAAQTPQGVRAGLLRAAFERFPPDGPDTFTDEASLLEACSIDVHVVPGDPGNLKVTLPDDLGRVAAALSTGAGRVGIGHDQHPFGPGAPLVLGGVEIAGAPRLRGHSDGDAATHAIADALLGAASLGDLGRVFPAGPETPAGIDSGVMLAEVVRRVREAGWRPVNVDLTIVAARPRLGDHLDPMRAALAARLGLPADAVGLKASTGNLAGDEGAGRGIAALAMVLLEPVA